MGLSDHEIIASSLTGREGLSQGVMGMRRGGTRRIHIPPSLGFGQRGSQKYKIPGGSNLVIGAFSIPP